MPDQIPAPAPASAARMVLVSEATLRAAGWRTLREWHEEGAGYGLAEFFFTMNGINPDEWAPPALAAAQPAPAPAEERMQSQLIDERDRATEAADRLAYALFGVEEIGEHTNLNCPWENAAERLESMAASPSPSASRAEASLREALARYEAADECCACAFTSDMKGTLERRAAENERRNATVALAEAAHALLAQHPTPTPPAGAGAQAEELERLRAELARVSADNEALSSWNAKLEAELRATRATAQAQAEGGSQ